VQSIGRFHDALIMHSPRASRTPYLPVELKRKLRHPSGTFGAVSLLGTSNEPQVGPVGELLSGTLAFEGTALRRMKGPGLHRPGPSEGAYWFHLIP
jgi:hypothetical protein